MEVLWIVTLFTLGIVRTESLSNEGNQDKLTYVDLLEDALKAQPWTQPEEPCLNTMLKIMDNAKNSTLWTVWFLDANQIPIGHLYGQRIHLGHYDECLNPNLVFKSHSEVPTTQYCLVNVTLTEAEKQVKPRDYVLEDHNVTTNVYLKKPTKHGEFLSSMQWGVCVPEICQSSSTSKIARSLLQVSHLGALSDSARIFPIFCESKALLEKIPTTGPTIFKLLLMLLTTTSLVCTWYVKNGKTPLGPFVSKLVQAFCLKRNMESLTKTNKDELYCINFLRTATCSVVVGLHYFMFLCHFTFNGLDLNRIFDEFGYGFAHIEIVVDTFLALSGLLFTRGILSDRWQNPLKYIWKRYIRLATAFGASIVFMVAMSVHIGSGPLWFVYMESVRKPCENYWLVNMLMFGNEVDGEKLCHISTWYVACDFQLCVIATILFLIYKRNKIIGIYAFAFALGFSLVYPGIVTYINNYPVMMFHGIRSIVESGKNVVFNSVYTKSYCRAGPFLVGGLMGYLMYTYKPKDHRKVMGKLSSHLAVAISLIIMTTAHNLGFHYYLMDEPLNSAIYVAVHRTFWGLAVCIIIGVSEYGDLSILTRIYTWYPWIPISRLTYGVYITHIIIIEFLFFSARTTHAFDATIMFMAIVGFMVLCLISALFLWLFVEAPIININNMLLEDTWKTETAKTSGVNVEETNGKKSDGLVNDGKKSN